MKKKILGVGIAIILVVMLFILTGCKNNNNDNLDENDSIEVIEENENKIDYSLYTDLYSSKISSASLYYYGIVDLDNDDIPELIGKSENEQEPNFKVYKLENEELKEITDTSSKTYFSGIENITKNEYEDGKNVFIIDKFASTYTDNGAIIDFAYIKDNVYIEYSKLVGLDLDTLSTSKIYKKTLDIKTLEVTEKEYSYTIDTSKSFDNALISSEYEHEITNIKNDLNNNLKNTTKLEFYESDFSEWEHDNTELKKQVKNILEVFSNSKETNTQEEKVTTESKNSNIKLDARYVCRDDTKVFSIDLYSDNTVYYTYVPKTGRSEYYTGTFVINGSQITVNLIPDDYERTQIMKQENPKVFTIISNEEFKDKNDNVYKYSVDYKKGQYSQNQ